MKNILFLIPFVSYLISDIFHVPSEYPTIQEGIDSSADGDTVLVSQGIYYENILIDKSITLASYAIFDNLDNWAEYDDQIFYEWQVSNSNIQNTIIDGGQPLNPDYGSTILISSDNQNICITPQIIGFTIQYGTGTLVNRHLDEDTDGDGQNDDALHRIGGGILVDLSNPVIEYNQIKNNGSQNVNSGGGIYITTSEEDWDFNNRNRNSRNSCNVYEYNLRNNLYFQNDAQYGKTHGKMRL